LSTETPIRPPNPDETLVLLVRHAESTWNAAERFQGQAHEVPLSEFGRKQAEALANWVASQHLGTVHIYSSDSLRAHETAQALANAIAHKSFTTDPALREVSVGEWQGLTREEVEARWPGQLEARHNSFESHRIAGGESGTELQERAFGYFSRVLRNHMGETIILVSHGGTLAALRTAIEGWRLNEAWVRRWARLPNTGVTAIIYNHTQESYTLLFAGSESHLDAISEAGIETE
jgi:broad specificity phosphatase PhoE